jgi:hypothetical protein
VAEVARDHDEGEERDIHSVFNAKVKGDSGENDPLPSRLPKDQGCQSELDD